MKHRGTSLLESNQQTVHKIKQFVHFEKQKNK